MNFLVYQAFAGILLDSVFSPPLIGNFFEYISLMKFIIIITRKLGAILENDKI